VERLVGLGSAVEGVHVRLAGGPIAVDDRGNVGDVVARDRKITGWLRNCCRLRNAGTSVHCWL
jgi:hypothetical protein